MLPDYQVDRFYDLWLPLLEFTNLKTKTLPRSVIKMMSKAPDLASENTLKVALWNNIWIIDEYVQNNPYHLNAADLELVASWRTFRFGDFLLLRVVRGLGIFLSQDEPGEFFAVNPLYSPFESLLPEFPVMVRTAILPFENVLVYDGSMTSYAIRFGPGFREAARFWYIDAKEKHIIRTTFLPDSPVTKKEKLAQINQTNHSVLRYFKSYLKSDNHSEKIINRDFQTVRDFAEFLIKDEYQEISLRDLTKESFDQYILAQDNNIQRSAIIGLRRFFEYLRDTERMDWGLAVDILDKLRDL